MFCLMPDKVEEFKQALKDKSLDLAELLDPKMTSEARTEIFRKYAGDNAADVNKLFESKLVLKNRILGIENFVRKVGEMGKYGPEGKAAAKQAVSDYRAAQFGRVFNPGEHEAFLNDLADKMVGGNISREVAQKVFELSAKADALRDVNPKMSGVSDEYLSARNALNAYVSVQKSESLSSIGRNLSIIGRNNLLFNPATPVKTAIGQAVNSVMDAITRRIGTMTMRGENVALAAKAKAEAWATYVKTGVNTASMENMKDLGLNKLGERLHGPTLVDANAPGVMGKVAQGVSKVAQVSNKIVIDWEHNYAFTKFYHNAFFDSANLMATDVAKEMGTKAEDVFRDAVRVEPETQAGAMVRLESQKQAARITSTNPTWLSRLALGVREGINKVTPNFPLGDLLIPIAKIPSTIIANAIENAGPGLFMGARDIIQGRVKIASTDMATRLQGMAQMSSGIQRMSRTFGVMATAAYFTSQLDKSDFKEDHYGNLYVKVAGEWINAEYFNAISGALGGMLWAKYKSTPGEGLAGAAVGYAAGTAQNLKHAPGIDELGQLVAAVTSPNAGRATMRYAGNFFTSRGVPAFIPALLKDRPMNRLFFGAHGVETPEDVRRDNADAARQRALNRLQ